MKEAYCKNCNKYPCQREDEFLEDPEAEDEIEEEAKGPKVGVMVLKDMIQISFHGFPRGNLSHSFPEDKIEAILSDDVMGRIRACLACLKEKNAGARRKRIAELEAELEKLKAALPPEPGPQNFVVKNNVVHSWERQL